MSSSGGTQQDLVIFIHVKSRVQEGMSLGANEIQHQLEASEDDRIRSGKEDMKQGVGF